MPQYPVNQRKVEAMVKDFSVVLENKGATNVEVILALVELAGRVIVNISETSVICEQLTDVAKQHLDTTIRVGAQAMHKSSIIHTLT